MPPSYRRAGIRPAALGTLAPNPTTTGATMSARTIWTYAAIAALVFIGAMFLGIAVNS